MNNLPKNNQAFTLIELLVVIAIIGLLSTMVVISVKNARVKARDARRLADLKQIHTAIELYYDLYGHYPTDSYMDTSVGCITGEGQTLNDTDSWDDGFCLGGTTLDFDLHDFINTMPVDPINNTYYVYNYDADCYSSGAQCYSLSVRLEKDDQRKGYCGGSTESYPAYFYCNL